ncbi:MAG: protein translocase subunit SecDF [Verrucomicrobia bacterium]|nr:MAG: protein translocase subunit SecDF [Verrucomicrobiota bacterium]
MSADNINKSIFWKFVITGLVILWAVSSMVPFDDTPFEDFIKTRATAHTQEFAELLAKAGERVQKGATKANPDKSPTLYIALRDYSDANNIDLSKFFPEINVRDIKVLKKRNDVLLKELYRQSKGAIKKGLDLQGGVSFTLEVDDKEKLNSDEQMRKGQLEDVLTVMNKRVNGLGVTEPTIRIMGNSAIEVQMPGVSLKDNPEAIEELSRPAKLEFKLVHRFETPSSAKPPAREIPVGYEVKVMEEERNGKLIEKPFYVKKRPEATGEIVARASAGMEDANRFRVDMEFTSEGSKTFERITRSILEEDQKTGVKQPLAIVLDGRLLSAPNIQSVISSRGQITGSFSRREAIELANALNNPLAFGLKRTSLSEVGPSLAEDAKDKSYTAAAIGTAAVVVFMILIYTWFGIIALISVLANIVILIGVLASFNATITLPGIAALILTIGMAVDSNILVFERMREELRHGKTLWTSLGLGYEKAFSTIVDANITTLLSAIILYIFGTGPVKGFGVTLAVGIFTTLFCALVFSRAMLEFAVKFGWVKKALTFSLIRENTAINFFKYARPSFAISWLIVLIGVGVIAMRGDKTLSIDFTGGDVVTVAFDPAKKIPIGEITALSESTSDTGLGEIQAAYKTDLSSKAENLVLQVESEKGQRVFDKLAKQFPDAKLHMIAQQSVGAAVSKSITIDAFKALGLSLLVILLYVAVRFEFSYGIGAIVATVHDVVLTVGLYVILGLWGVGSGQFSAAMIAAVLMVMGYSINDKIVVFDRIREELTLKPTMTLRDIINYAINRTLSRTLLTSLSTFLAALALFIFGTGIIVDFSLVFMLGIVAGTFSSIFIASPVFYWWNKGSRAKVAKESDKQVVHEWEK